MANTEVRIHHVAAAKFTVTILVLTLLLSLLNIISAPGPAISSASPDEVKWSRVNIPTEGEAGNWVLAGGSNIRHLTMAADGTLYCHANPSGTSYTLFKSADAGYSWSPTGQVTGTIAGIATAPDDASIVYYATVSKVYQSVDAGTTFTLLPLSPGGVGSDNITITSLDIARLDGNSIIAVGTKDTDDSQYGGVYILDENTPFTGWINTNIGNYDVCTIAFSPNFAADRQLAAVVTDETDTRVTTRIDDADWGQAAGDATIEGLAAISAAIAFPDDYDATTADYALFVAIDTGSDSGDVYMVHGVRAPGSSMTTDLDIGSTYNLSSVDVAGLAVSGNTTTASLLAGTANSAQVYISTDSGLNWTRSTKAPTGQSRTCLLMAPGFTSCARAYTATRGNESAFSYTTDGGVTWNQIGLIDTRISQNGIVDLAVSPDYSQDNTLFLLTFDGVHTEHSLWRSVDNGVTWERLFTSTLASGQSISLVELPPQYSGDCQVVFLAGTGGSNSTIWRSTNNGQTFTQRSAPFSIDTWAAANDNTLFFASYNGSAGLIYHTTSNWFSYSTGTVAGSQPLASIALSPGYEQDSTILTGNTNGWVYWSADNGISFQPLPPDATSPPLTGSVTVAFDPEFSNNKVVYAASDTADEGIHRFTVNKSTNWESIDSALPTGSMLSQVAVATDGTLYATNLEADGGMERSLNPAYPLGPTFETVTRGLYDSASLTGLWLRNNQLWSIDNQNTRLMTYTDSLTLPVTLTSPANKAAGTDTGNTYLEWETLKGATGYKWQLDYDTDFSTVPSGFEGDTRASSARLPALETATTYYWRVRATEPVISCWSAKWSFTTSLGTTVTASELYSPKAGATGVSIKPIFQWSAIAGADSYELLVSTDASFANPVIVKIGDYALPTTAWQSNMNLGYNTTYYWKVRASGSGSHGTWSAAGAFTTALPPSVPSSSLEQPASSSPQLSPLQQPPTPPTSPPQQSSPPPPPPQSPPPTQSTLPDWVIYLGSALLLTTVLLLITLVVLVAGIRRP